VSLSARVGEFMKIYSLVIVMYLMYTGIMEFSANGTGPFGIMVWVLLAVIGVYGILTFVIVEGLEFT
jgi:hypothetical protein